MSTLRLLSTALLVTGLGLTTACARDTPTPSTPKPASTQSAADGTLANSISQDVTKALGEAHEKISQENLKISRDGSLPKAEITPTGDLLIDGKAVGIDDRQRSLVLDYRQHILGIAQAGIDIGVQGVGLAGKAVTETLAGVFTGNTDKIEEKIKKIEAEAVKIEASAKKICSRLPAMLTSQEKLKAALPAFAPYARMTQSDVKDCEENGHFSQ